MPNQHCDCLISADTAWTPAILEQHVCIDQQSVLNSEG